MPEIPLLAAKTAGRAFFDVPLSSTDYNMRAHILMHPIQDVGGNPVLIYRHGGGGTSNDARLPFLSTTNGNALCFYLSQMRRGANDLHFTIVSIETPQSEYRNSMALTRHSEDASLGWAMGGVRTRPSNFPANIEAVQAAIVALKTKAPTYNLDPNKMILMGSSYGAIAGTLSQLFPPIVHSAQYHSSFGLGRGPVDSTVRGVIAHQLIPDIRSKIPGTPYHNLHTGCSWVNGTLTLTLGTPSTATVAVGTIVYAYAGTSTTLGKYRVTSVPSTSTIVLDRSIGASASNVSIVLTTEKYGPGGSATAGGIADIMGFGTLDSNGMAAQYLGLPPAVREAFSVAWYVETGQWPSWMPPVYACTERMGNGFQPYGVAEVGTATSTTADIHDAQQIRDLLALASAKGVDINGQVFPFTDWETEANAGRHTAAEQVYNWMRGILSTQVEPTVKSGVRERLSRIT